MSMKKFVAILLLCLATPAAAEEDNDGGFSLMEEGAQMILRGLMQEMEPAMNDLETMMKEFGPAMDQFAAELGPVLAELLQKVDDLSNYEQPEVLPNGDIIIRRKPDAPEFEPDANGAIEL